MFIILKKKSIYVLSLVLVIICLIVVAGFEIKDIVCANDKAENQKIIIDAGHGGFDGGAVGVDNTVEKELNLAYALELGSIMKKRGFNVIYTRTDDESTNTKNNGKIGFSKKDDILNRFKIIEQNPDAIFISIHMNKYSSQNCRGYQMFYSPKNQKSKVLAEIITNNFNLNLNPVKKRLPKKCGKNVYLIYNSKIPSVLVECGFISNYDDLKLLKTSDYRKKMMSTLSKSIVQFLNTSITPEINTAL